MSKPPKKRTKTELRQSQFRRQPHDREQKDLPCSNDDFDPDDILFADESVFSIPDNAPKSPDSDR